MPAGPVACGGRARRACARCICYRCWVSVGFGLWAERVWKVGRHWMPVIATLQSPLAEPRKVESHASAGTPLRLVFSRGRHYSVESSARLWRHGVVEPYGAMRTLTKWFQPTRLETRTKESNIYASRWVAKPTGCTMKVKGTGACLRWDGGHSDTPAPSADWEDSFRAV